MGIIENSISNAAMLKQFKHEHVYYQQLMIVIRDLATSIFCKLWCVSTVSVPNN